jgi:hypothetical protein
MEDQKVKNLGDVWHHYWRRRKSTGIRFNIFQLNQTYLGKDSRLNIGPKGFTGEKYGSIGIRKPIVFLLYGYKKINKLLEIYWRTVTTSWIKQWKCTKHLGLKSCPLSNGYHDGENATMNGKSHMKKSIETDDCFIFNYYPLPVITLIFLKRTRSFNWYCTLLASKS